MGQYFEMFFRWVIEMVQVAPERLTVFFQGVIDAIGTYLGPLAQVSGGALTVLLMVAIPGLAVYGAVRLMAAGTERVLGRSDARATVLVFSVALGFLFGGLFIASASQGVLALCVVGSLLFSSTVGLALGGIRVLGRRASLYIASAPVIIAIISAPLFLPI
jgi:hypothetical protein